MKTNRITLALCAAISALVFGCEGPDWPAPDTEDDGPSPDDDLGLDEEAQVVAAGVLSAIVASPFGMYMDPVGPTFRQCGTGNGATGLISCAGKNLFSPPARFFNIATNSTTFQASLASFCVALHNKIAGWQCTATAFTGAVCPTNVELCVRNTSVTSGGSAPVYDLRRYQRGACINSNPAHTTTFRGVSYSNRKCNAMEFEADKAVMVGEGGSKSSALITDVMWSIGMQAIGQGVTAINTDQAYSATWSVGVTPYKPHGHFVTNGQICRTNQYQAQEDGAYVISDAAGCGND